MRRKKRFRSKKKVIVLSIILAFIVLAIFANNMYKRNISKQSVTYLKIAESEYSNKNYDVAIKYFKKSIELNPTYDAYKGLASSYDALGKKILAVEFYTKAMRLNPTNGEAYRLLGKVFSSMGEYELAITQFKKALEFNQRDFKALNELGRSYSVIGNYNQSLKFYSKSLSAHFNIQALEGIGISYLNLQDYNNSIKYLSKAYETGNYTINGIFELAFAHIMNGDYDKATEIATSQINNLPAKSYENYKMNYILGTIYLLKKDADKSVHHFNLSHNSNTCGAEEPFVTYRLGIAYLLKKDYKKAIEYLEQSFNSRASLLTYDALALAYKLSGDMGKIKNFDISKASLKENYISRALLGMAYLDYDEYEMAINEFNRLISLNPNYYLPYEGLGKAYFKQGDYQKAEESIKKSLELNPNSEESKRMMESIKTAKKQ